MKRTLVVRTRVVAIPIRLGEAVAVGCKSASDNGVDKATAPPRECSPIPCAIAADDLPEAENTADGRREKNILPDDRRGQNECAELVTDREPTAELRDK